MTIYIGADHGGFGLKEEIKKFLGGQGYEVEDMGAQTLNPTDDYPDLVIPVGEKVVFRQAQGDHAFGIVIGRSGNGEAIAANKINGVRAALCMDEESARLAREKNDANVLALGADFVDADTVEEIIKTFLETPFSDDQRHRRRIGKIQEYELAHTSE